MFAKVNARRLDREPTVKGLTRNHVDYDCSLVTARNNFSLVKTEKLNGPKRRTGNDGAMGLDPSEIIFRYMHSNFESERGLL